MATKLQVKDLKISFRTVSGKLKAVRDISFDLEEGETLAIVGESGSGKSVTSKAILGILAGNSIVEGGEILYDGMDLLKIPEEEFYKIRGDKIAMIFQDPLSSLNPIMRIGKQLTEAMILKGKARQRASRAAFNGLLGRLEKMMIEAVAQGDSAKAAAISASCKNFDKFEFKHIALEKEYNIALDAAKETADEISDIIFHMEKDALADGKRVIRESANRALKSIHPYVVSGEDAEAVKKYAGEILSGASAALKSHDYSALIPLYASTKEILDRALEKEMPNFFSMGYYLTFSGEPLPDMPIGELNKFLRKYLDDNFMLAFIENVEAALKYSAKQSYAAKETAVSTLSAALETINTEGLNEKNAKEIASTTSKAVKAGIDPLAIVKDSPALTFGSGLEDAIEVYFTGIKKNSGEEARYNKEKAKYDAYVAKNKRTPDWKPVPAAVVDLDLALDNIIRIITNLSDHYSALCDAAPTRAYHDEAVAIIDYLKMNASGVVNHITRRMAKHKAIKLMEEVGIPEPRRRYKQYPFEFSGGMRQRIVIAIALAADPDILICDEPTTALDVTIQAQILELINRLKKERNLSIIFITHDLGVVANMADKIAVMYAGKIVEYGTSEDVFYRPAHPYTWALLSSMPDLDTNDKLESIPGTPPNMIFPPVGDAFAERNKYALKIDFEKQPPMFKITDTHSAATWLLHPNAPKVDPPKIVTDRIERMKSRANNA